MKVVMIGTGYVGLVSGTCLAEVGHHVTCVDVDAEKVARLKDAISPIFEPGLDVLIRRNLEQGRLDFTDQLAGSLKGADMVFIAVGTPEGEDGSADLKHVTNVATSLGQLLDHKVTVIVKSTVPVGTCDMVEQVISDGLTQRKVDFAISVASNPEFLKEGDAISDFMKPDRIIVGLADRKLESEFLELYKPFILDDLNRLIFMNRRSSELTKYAANSMLATRVSFMNELSVMCEHLGADVDMVRHGMGTDPRIGKKFLFAGPGYGGSCFPKDVAALRMTAKKTGVQLRILDAVSEANEHQKLWVSQKIVTSMGSEVRGKKIALWGLAFKPGTDDIREAPAKTIIHHLLSQGAQVVAHDPKGTENFQKDFGEHPNLSYVQNAQDGVKGASALVLVTEWSEYKRPDWQLLSSTMQSGAHIFDLRNQYDRDEVVRNGLRYRAVGRSFED